ncbi:MAG TPA: hypothetical protein VIJ72_01810 [Rhizomicrobium sp.]
MRAKAYLLIAALSALILAPAMGDDAPPQKKPEHKVTQSKSYVAMDALYATIPVGDRPRGLLEIIVGLDIPNEALRDTATNAMPILRDAYVRNLMAFAATRVRINHQPDVAMIADRLQGVTDRALGKKGARVLLVQVALSINR